MTSLQPEKTVDENMKFIGVPYYGKFTNTLGQKLKNFGIKLAFQNRGCLSEHFPNLKDRQSDEKKKSGIYMLNCRDCSTKYIGQTKRQIKTRRDEHINDCFKPENQDSAMAYHCITQGHAIEDVSLLKEVDEAFKLNCWESLMLQKHKEENLCNIIKTGNAPSILFDCVNRRNT